MDEKIAQGMKFAATLDATVELCGTWIWVEFAGKPDADVRQSLKDAGFRWAPQKAKWYLAGAPTVCRKSMPMDYIYEKSGRQVIAEA